MSRNASTSARAWDFVSLAPGMTRPSWACAVLSSCSASARMWAGQPVWSSANELTSAASDRFVRLHDRWRRRRAEVLAHAMRTGSRVGGDHTGELEDARRWQVLLCDPNT